MVNTVLAISGSCLGAVFTVRILLGKLNMEEVLNATLAGGVIIGSSSDMCH
jgi:ammonia channel protein AmtB